jgi:hypothetical protein
VLVGVPPKTRAKATNDPLRGRGRSPEARRLRDLFRSYLMQLGSPTDAATQALILAAAEAVVIAEGARADMLAGKGGAGDAVVRLENLADRKLRRLGLNKPTTPPRKSFMEKMAEHEAAQRAAEARTEADLAAGRDVAAGQDQRIAAAPAVAAGSV